MELQEGTSGGGVSVLPENLPDSGKRHAKAIICHHLRVRRVNQLHSKDYYCDYLHPQGHFPTSHVAPVLGHAIDVLLVIQVP